jgi:glutamate racemase
VDEAEIAREIAPAFVEREGKRTDEIVLACTHFPLLADRLRASSPWQVEFVDPAPAIARRVDALLGPARPVRRAEAPRALFSSGRAPSAALQKALLERGLIVSSA